MKIPDNVAALGEAVASLNADEAAALAEYLRLIDVWPKLCSIWFGHENADAKALASELGKLGGRLGGMARAKALTPERRSEIAKKAAAKRWGHK